MRWQGAVATVGYVSTNSSVAGSPRPPVMPAVTERQRLGLAAALTAVACLAAIALVLTLPMHARGPRLVLAILMCIPVISLGKRWPLSVLGLAIAAAAAQMTSGGASLLMILVLGLAGYTVGAGVPRRLSIRAVLAAAGALGGALAYAGLTLSAAPLPAEAVQGFLPLAAGWFIGDSVGADGKPTRVLSAIRTVAAGE